MLLGDVGSVLFPFSRNLIYFSASEMQREEIERKEDSFETRNDDQLISPPKKKKTRFFVQNPQVLVFSPFFGAFFFFFCGNEKEQKLFLSRIQRMLHWSKSK